MGTKNNIWTVFEKIFTRLSKAAGSTVAFSCALLLVLTWAIGGSFFGSSEVWQLVIHTGIPMITFLMVFLIQKTQNKDSLAIELKLNELIASQEYASNRLLDIKDMTEEEMKVIQKYYRKLSYLSREEDIKTCHSIEEAHTQHALKHKKRIRHRKTAPFLFMY